jgi:2-polyprenyl-3-methyl-5-hydroxy-6-metoxy-1,4-benzoquinol methylase
MTNTCIICDSTFKKINEFISKCTNCAYYKSSLKPGFGRGIDGIDKLRKKNFQKIIHKIKSINRNEDLKILEFGSGGGFFIEECKKMRIDITGSEADKKQYFVLKEKFKNVVEISLPLKIEKNDLFGNFDFIIFNDVFEHLENLNLVSNQIEKFLKKNGHLIINLPSSDGFIFKISELLNKVGLENFYNRLWQKNLPSPHLSYFNKLNLESFLNKFNYDLIYSDSLDSIGKEGNFDRLNSTIKNKFICLILSSMIFFLYYLQKILPKDIIFQIYKKS